MSSLFSLGDHEADYIAWDGPDGRSGFFFVDAIFFVAKSPSFKEGNSTTLKFAFFICRVFCALIAIRKIILSHPKWEIVILPLSGVFVGNLFLNC